MGAGLSFLYTVVSAARALRGSARRTIQALRSGARFTLAVALLCLIASGCEAASDLLASTTTKSKLVGTETRAAGFGHVGRLSGRHLHVA